jgi:SAM-dependent methyltransferase
MRKSPLNDAVATQYAEWMYPEPIVDLPGWLQNNWQWFDPSHAHKIFWPDRSTSSPLSILVAGCGTNQAAVLAYNNPDSRVLAIDVSEPSLLHHRFLADQYNLSNLELRQLPIEESHSLSEQFDLIISTGVLHHLHKPIVGTKALAACLKPHGVLAIMLYARYGRIGVEMLQSIFRELGLQQNEVSLLMVKDALAALAEDHPLKTYLGLAPDLNFDAGLVDTFLHGRDRSFTVEDCLELADAAGLAFQEWFLKTPYYASSGESNAFMTAVAALPDREQWAVMERINARNACHFFVATPKERPLDAYAIDFQSPQVIHHKPSFRFRCGLEGAHLYAYNRSLPLNAIELALAQKIDGLRSVREIVAEVHSSGVLPRQATTELEQLALDFFASLWRRDFLAIELEPKDQRVTKAAGQRKRRSDRKTTSS